VDKASAINCVCNVGSYHIFGETWYSRVYDVPGLPIRSGDVVLDIGGYSGEGERRFRREPEQRSRAKVNSSRSEATLAF